MSRRSRSALGWGRVLGCLSIAVVQSACAADAHTEDPVERGQALFDSGALSDSGRNLYRCSTCHDARPGASERLKPGAVLAGATRRPSYWGGQESDLLHAIDDCRSIFMYASEPLVPGEPEADDLYRYIASLAPGDAGAVPFTVVRTIEDVPRGDAVRGAAMYTQSCGQCHGAMHTGEGQLSASIPILPDDTLAAHPPPAYSPRLQRLVFIEKTRHGLFLGYGGDMPPFSLETLPDASLSDILEALAVVGQ